jgi:hypothetical protein
MFSKTMTKNKAFVVPTIGSLVILLVIGLFFWKSQNTSSIKAINSFEDCAKAGYPIMEIFPEQCRVPGGKTFTKQVSEQSNWQEETIEEIGLTFKHPKDLVYRKEIADDDGRIRTAGFFLTKGSENNPEYQMYGLYQQFKDATEQDLELSKREMDPNTIKEVTIDGYKGIEGLILGQKTRYITIILKGSKLFSVSTMPPTLENKAVTEAILPTLNFY